MIKASRKGRELIQEIKSYRKNMSGFNFWWLGQSGFLIQWEGKYLLLDPYLSDSLTRKYQDTDKQHIRMTELVADPGALDFIDAVTSSHNHTDHLDADTLLPLMKSNPKMEIIIPRANHQFVVDRLGCDSDTPICLNENEKIELESGFTIHGIAAAHNDLLKDDKGNCRFMGYVISFGEYTIYHSGDTLWRDEIIEALEPFDIDVAFLPINGNKPERRVAGNLNATEAVKMGKLINAKLVIPCHYHMFTFNTVDPGEFQRLAKEKEQVYKVMLSGERYHYN
ncbi:MAG: L-ascorbate metabolism protein UlaG (beta-lactamase superfamily) [Saprospiraceae bacterium]|jgi:L-ascorbate metabolism protein UlaG (beta-lactamase superfamily)